MSEPPRQAQFLRDSFNGEFVLETWSNPNPHKNWMLKQDDVTLYVDETENTHRNEIQLALGRNGNYAERQTGAVRSEYVTVKYDCSDKNVGKINKSKKEALSSFANQSDDLYEAFVAEFGSDVILEDNR